jgi:PTS system nitrogen regulatory IIA component
MKIGDILTQDLVIPELKATDKVQALGELVTHIADRVPDISSEELLSVLLEREQLGSTGIGDGVAIPHGKLKGIQNIIAVFAKSVLGVAFDSMDSKPVHLFFLLVAPENSAGIHLKALARLSRLLKSNGFRQKLMGVSDAKDLYSIIVQEDEKYVL